jgi:hypothetical protein
MMPALMSLTLGEAVIIGLLAAALIGVWRKR